MKSQGGGSPGRKVELSHILGNSCEALTFHFYPRHVLRENGIPSSAVS